MNYLDAYRKHMIVDVCGTRFELMAAILNTELMELNIYHKQLKFTYAYLCK